ncbi:N-acetyltransferase [Halobacillus salinus]|uniref:N-acetyltransferase n=1 Tax=Halobacillus salinus TaxID=192814 RepID=A0A4Z0H0Q0_9BACI|nr:N-acetyltransferase [Halobacillus salinus]
MLRNIRIGDDRLQETRERFDASSKTDRLQIRPLQKSDYETWLQGFTNRYPSQYRHDAGQIDMSECTEEWFGGLVDKHQELASNDTAHVFGVFRIEDGKHIGMVDFSTLARDNFQWGRLGYTIHNQFWRQGYGKEAVGAALQIAFTDLGFHRIEAHINTDNDASVRLAESVGMEYECTRKGFINEFEEWTDHLVFYKNAQ